MNLLCVLVLTLPATDRTPQLQEWEQLHYGMFFHYGMSTFTGREIDPGDAPIETYQPTDLDVRQWIRVARDAGMRYAVLTAKHVAGHCLWDSADYDYDIGTTGDVDVVAEFMAACAEYGLVPGLYYCVLDGHNEGGVLWQAGVGDDYFALISRQLRELHMRYPGLREQWIDIPGKLTPAQRQALYDLIKELSPDCLVIMNQGFQDGVAVPEWGWPTDLLNGERTVPPEAHEPRKPVAGTTHYLPMEVCDTIGGNWFWVPDDPPRPLRALVQLYRQSVGRGANLLLNVPPDTSGRIPQESVDALMALKRVIDDPALVPDRPSLTAGAAATASNIYQNQTAWTADQAVDGDWNTRWATDHGVTSGWLEVDLGAERTFDRAVLSEGWDRTRRWELQAWRDGEWQTFAQGERIGSDLEIGFAPVSTRRVRLNVLESTNGPTIWEFALYQNK